MAPTATWINLKSAMLGFQSQIQDHILYDSTYIKYQKRQNYGNRIQISSCQRPKDGSRRRLTINDKKKLVGVMKIFYIPTMLVVIELYEFVKSQRVVHLKLVDFIVCKLYVNKTDFKKIRNPGVQISSLSLTYQMPLTEYSMFGFILL